MKKIITFFSLGFLALLLFTEAKSQTLIDAEFRPRTEVRQGFRKPLADSLKSGLVTLQRSRLNTDYKGKILNARITLQDARIWGNSDTKTNTSKVEIYEAWFEYLISSGFSAQIGRQALKYDDMRLFSSPNWSNTGTAHDAIILKYKSPVIQAHAGFAYNNTKDTLLNVSYGYTPKNNYKSMGYIWLSKEIISGLSVSLIGVCDGFEKPKTVTKVITKTTTIPSTIINTVTKDTVTARVVTTSTSTTVTNTTNPDVLYPRITYGGNLIYANDSGSLGGILTFYKQQGKCPLKTFNTGYAELNAFFAAAKVSYKFNKKLSANLGFDFYSGSDTSNVSRTGKTSTFNRLYGATHSFNGNMEYFVTLPDQGLFDYYVGCSGQVTSKCTVDLSVHAFYFDKDFYYNKVKTSKNLGSEVDLVMNYKVSKEIFIQAGYSRYLTTSTTSKYFKMNDIGVHSPQWAYIMFTVRPQLYKTPEVSKE